jgi:hypothetical protein
VVGHLELFQIPVLSGMLFGMVKPIFFTVDITLKGLNDLTDAAMLRILVSKVLLHLIGCVLVCTLSDSGKMII